MLRMNTLLSDIEAFLIETGMTEATFCRAVGNGRLMQRLRRTGTRGKPGRLWPESERQIRDFMAIERAKRRVAA